MNNIFTHCQGQPAKIIIPISKKKFDLFSFLFIIVLFKQMFNFPINIKTLIMAYADESVENSQKKSLKECLKTINKLPDGWYYNHILHQDSNYGSDWDGDGDEGEHIGFYIFFIMNEHALDGFLSNDYEDFNERRITDFKNRIKSY